jgi:hypothetical protein
MVSEGDRSGDRSCCGKARATPYCPQCGRRLGGAGPLWDLLAHCRKTVATQEKTAAGYRAAFAAGDKYLTRERVEAVEQAAAKWGAWADALAELLEARQGGGTGDGSGQG